MTGNGRAAIGAAAAAVLAAGCAASAPGHAASAPVAVAAKAQPANPAPILRATGAHVPAGEIAGDHDVFGDRMATGTMHRGWEQVIVYTAASGRALRAM